MNKTTWGKSCIAGVLLFTLGAYAGEITIGTGTGTWYYPLSTNYHDARTQTIYLASEIGGAKTLDWLSLNVATIPGQTMNNFTIRLKHTDLSSYGSNPVWESSDWTIVYQTNQTISTTNWVTFVFTTPFAYNGTQNLMVDISFNNSSDSRFGYCYYTLSSVYRSLYCRVDSAYGSPLTWSNRTPTPTPIARFPNIRLGGNFMSSVEFTPDGGTYNTEQNVVISCATAGATIHYTIDGNDPIENDPVIASGDNIYIDQSLTLKARAWKAGLEPSIIKSATYQIVAATPVFTPDGGPYDAEQIVVITCTTPGATIYYTTNGVDPIKSDPNIASGGSVTVSVDSPTFLKARAFKTGQTPSTVKTALYYHFAGGSGIAQDPYQINSKELLLALALDSNQYNKCFILTEDINLNGQIFTAAVLAPDTSSSTSDFQGTAFTGSFDGDGHTISNFSIEGVDYLGLFGNVGTNAQIKNLGIANVSITGRKDVGGLAGKVDGTITSCYVTGSVSGSSSYIGGLIGYNSSGSISNCYATNTVSGSSGVGGLTGENQGTISHCRATGMVSGSFFVGGLVGYSSHGTISHCYATGMVNGYYYVGGLTGINYGTISHCYATGTVSGSIFVGGLVGYNESTISNCYETGTVSGSSYHVGGLTGCNNYATISNCYAAGAVIGTASTIGGLVGVNSYSTVQNSFWDTQTSGRTVGVGSGSSSGITGKATAEMQTLSTFTSAGWDFTTLWDICQTTNYPRFQWQIPEADWICPDGVDLEDLEYFMDWWLETDCNSSNYCSGVDFDTSGKVDLEDWAIFAEHWMDGIDLGRVVVATPLFTPNGGTYNTEQTVTIICPTAGATIRYTTNGIDPNESDPVFTSGDSVLVDRTMTLKARAWKGNMTPSVVNFTTYQLVVADPNFSPGGGTYYTEQIVAITCATPGATIRYTLDGSDPNEGTVYDPNIPLVIDHSLTLKANAWKEGMAFSSVKSAFYTLLNTVVADPNFTPGGDAYYTEQNVVITCPTPGATIRYTLDGSDPDNGTIIENGGSIIVSVNPPTYLKARTFKDGLPSSNIKTAFYSMRYSAGAGTPEYPYRIASKANLLNLSAAPEDYSKCFILTDDIDLSGWNYNQAIIAPDINGSGFGGDDVYRNF